MCIYIKGIGTLTDVEGNINTRKYNEILDNNLWPLLARHFGDNQYVFMDDNAPVHRANLVKEYIANNNILVITEQHIGLSSLLDLNIIENIWLKIKRTLETRAEFINTKQQLMAEIRTAGKYTYRLY